MGRDVYIQFSDLVIDTRTSNLLVWELLVWSGKLGPSLLTSVLELG